MTVVYNPVLRQIGKQRKKRGYTFSGAPRFFKQHSRERHTVGSGTQSGATHGRCGARSEAAHGRERHTVGRDFYFGRIFLNAPTCKDIPALKKSIRKSLSAKVYPAKSVCFLDFSGIF